MSFLVFQSLQHRGKNTSKRWPAIVEGATYRIYLLTTTNFMQVPKLWINWPSTCWEGTKHHGGYRNVWGVPKEYVHWFYNLAGLMRWNESCPVNGDPLQILCDTVLPQNFSGLPIGNGMYFMSTHWYVHLEIGVIILKSPVRVLARVYWVPARHGALCFTYIILFQLHSKWYCEGGAVPISILP